MQPGWIGRVLVAMVATWAPSARACMCMHFPASRYVVPQDGSEGWPLDAAVWVILDRAWPRTAAAALAQDYRLREPDGDVVLLVGEADGFLLSLRPLRRLTPDTTYTIERLYTYGDGTLLSDDQLVALLEDDWPRQETPPTDVVRAWFPEQTFRTGDSDAPRVGASPRVTAARYDVDANSSCGRSESLTVEGEVAGEVARGTTIGVEVQGQGVVWRVPVGAGPAAEEPTRWTASTSDSLCVPQKMHVDVTAPVRVRATKLSRTRGI